MASPVPTEPQWRQGSVIPLDLVPKKDLPVDLPQDARLIVISHDCDIVSPSYLSEPWLELLIARPIASLDGQFTHGKNPRKLHITAKENGSERFYALDIHEKFRTSRQCLESGPPDFSTTLEKSATQLVARWVGKRYSRPSFPNLFEARIPDRVRKKIRKLLKRDGADVKGIFLALTDAELTAADSYEVILRVVVATEAAEDDTREEVALRVVSELQALMNECDGIHVSDADLNTLREFSLEDFLATKPWDYEYVSAEQGTNEDSLAEGI